MALHQHVSSMMETKDFTELFVDSRMKFVNISGFSLIILVGVSDYWDALCSFIRLNYFSICFNLTSIKLKTPFSLHLVMFGCFFYLSHFNPIQDGLFRGCSRMWWGQKGPLSLKSVTDILQWWNLAQLYLTQRRSKKHMNHVIYPLSSADISIFSPEINKFSYFKKYRYRLHFDTLFLFILTFLESL